MTSRPAYSAPFASDAVQVLTSNQPLDNITSAWAWEGSTGEGIKVAVIDSGIDADHPAVGGRIKGYVAVNVEAGPDGDTVVYDTAPHRDVFGHGTACAGIIRSLAPHCDLYSVRVLGPTNAGRGGAFTAGLRWAIDNGMHVCNLSLGTTKKDYFALLHELVDRAYVHNIMLVAAANNMPVPSFPSTYASVIAVAAHDVQEPYRIYYNPRPPIEFGALGIDVRVAWLDGAWMTSTGNSFAAPHITGLVARILAKHPTLTPFHMKAILRALAANVDYRG